MGAVWSFPHGADGQQTRRTNGTKTYNYIYNGSTLSQMTVGSDTLTFTYDASGRPLSVSLNGTTYYYATNLQGDVTAILNSSGTAVVNYTYDAWGNPLATTGDLTTTLGTLNPLRYRGYVYDQETELYYLQSRYYDPQIGRFLNADALTSTGQGILGNNMFAYCGNNPVVFIDYSGKKRSFATKAIGDDGSGVYNEYYAEYMVLNRETNMYKGVEVVWFENPFGSFSYGKIYLNTLEKADPHGASTLRHEYGHTIQLEKLGYWDYSRLVVAPSLMFATLSQFGNEFARDNYYSLPWEYEAEVYGNVQGRKYNPNVLNWYIAYRIDVAEALGEGR